MSIVDVTKLPSDSVYKFSAFAGIVLLIASASGSIWFVHQTQLEAFNLESRKGDAKAEYNKWLALHTEWQNAFKARNYLKGQIHDRAEEHKATKGKGAPTDPLTEEEKANIRKLRSTPEVTYADPENIIAAMEMMRDNNRNRPSLEQLQEAHKLADERATKFENDQKEFVDHGLQVDKLVNSVEVDTQRLAYLKSCAWWAGLAGVVGSLVGLGVAGWGFRQWHNRGQVLTDQILRQQAAGSPVHRDLSI